MSSEFNITLDHITLINDTNELIIKVPLDSLWDSIKTYEVAYVNAFLKIPLCKNEKVNTLFLTVHQEFLIANIPSKLKTVTLKANFEGIVDKSNQIVGFSTIICYSNRS